MTALLRPRLPVSTDFGNANSSARGCRAPKPVTLRAERRKCGFCCHRDAPLLWCLMGCKTIKRLRRLPHKSNLARERIGVINLTGVSSADQLNHGTFAENPRVVELIGRSIASGQTLTDSKVGFGEKILQTTAGATASVGHAAGLVVTAPVAIVDPLTREQFGDQIDAFGHSVHDAQRRNDAMRRTWRQLSGARPRSHLVNRLESRPRRRA
jgi:hypothetical protein